MINITKEQSEIWRKDDANWSFFKQIYYNKEDKRILVPKRIAWMGWTVNFANPKSIAFAVLLIIITILIVEKLFK